MHVGFTNAATTCITSGFNTKTKYNCNTVQSCLKPNPVYRLYICRCLNQLTLSNNSKLPFSDERAKERCHSVHRPVMSYPEGIEPKSLIPFLIYVNIYSKSVAPVSFTLTKKIHRTRHKVICLSSKLSDTDERNQM